MFTDSSVRIQHEKSTDTAKGQSPKTKTVPVCDENVEQHVSQKNTDQTGGVKEKQTISETDIPRGNLYSKKAVTIAITRLTNKYKNLFSQIIFLFVNRCNDYLIKP